MLSPESIIPSVKYKIDHISKLRITQKKLRNSKNPSENIVNLFHFYSRIDTEFPIVEGLYLKN